MHLSKEEYLEQFSDGETIVVSKQKEALERAWKNRDFEIELYWKRATYFWAFIASSFAGYMLIINSKNVQSAFPQAELILISMGFIFSLSWYLANQGSKKWQENWEKHIDMLEEKITGNIYKTVLNKTAYSVSGINLRVSLFVTLIWFSLLLIKYYHIILGINFSLQFDLITFAISVLTITFTILLFFERKPSPVNNKKDKRISFSLRKFEYKNPENNQE